MAEFSSKDESALTFKKGEIIAVVPKHDAYTEKVIINCIEYETRKFFIMLTEFDKNISDLSHDCTDH